jgi:hypothetical protein
MNSLDEVFGVSTGLVASYVERNEVDGYFRSALKGKKQIVVYGSSKQGKSSLIKKHLPDASKIQYQADPTVDLIDIYKSIVRQSGVKILTDIEEAEMKGAEAGGSVRVKVGIPAVAELEMGASGKGDKKKQNSQQFKTVEYNLALAQDIIELLKAIGFNKYIVIDNFHYLKEDVQQQFAFALRNFQDTDIRIIILGIWREQNRLLQFNGDLQDRITEVAVEPWEHKDLLEIIHRGGKILNVDFSDVEDELISTSFDSVGVLQELLKESCASAGVFNTVGNTVKITKEHMKSAIRRKLGSYSGRHERAFETFAHQDRKTRDGQVPLFIPYYFLKVLLMTDFEVVRKGLRRDYLHEKIAAIHHRPDDVRSGDMSNFLHTIINYQTSRKIIPPLFDYDRGVRTLKIIDSTLYFFLKNCNTNEVIDSIPKPSGEFSSRTCQHLPAPAASGVCIPNPFQIDYLYPCLYAQCFRAAPLHPMSLRNLLHQPAPAIRIYSKHNHRHFLFQN